VPHGSPFPLPAHQTGHANFPHPAFRLVSSRTYGELSIRASFISPPRLGAAIQLVQKAPGLMRCFTGSRQFTDPRLLQQAHQKSGSFPPPALPGFNSTTTLSDSHLCRRLYAPLRPLPSPMVGLPHYPLHLSGVPRPLPRRIETGALVDCFPAHAAFPVMQAVGIRTSTSRPAQASLTLRPVGLLNRLRRPLSRGLNPAGYPIKPLISYQSNRQLSGWNLPPLVKRALGAHCEYQEF
jgi:hypothetical protein